MWRVVRREERAVRWLRQWTDNRVGEAMQTGGSAGLRRIEVQQPGLCLFQTLIAFSYRPP